MVAEATLGVTFTCGCGAYVVGGWLDQVRIKLISASTGVAVEVGAELGKNERL